MTDRWDDLPAAVQAAVERHTGPVSHLATVEGGQNSTIAAVLQTQRGTVFLKGVRGISRPMRWLRNEVSAAAVTDGIAPAVLFSVDLVGDGDGWYIVGFEHLDGRPADLSPGSADLPIVATTVERVGSLPAHGLRGLDERWTVRDWWSRLADTAPQAVAGWDVAELDRWTATAPEAVKGDRLTHTDLHGDQFILGVEGVHVIDWGWPAAAAPWVDAAFLVLRLVEAGHSPLAAEDWARSLTCWVDADEEQVTAFAALVGGLWTHLAVNDRSRGADRRARVAREYAAWRIPGAKL